MDTTTTGSNPKRIRKETATAGRKDVTIAIIKAVIVAACVIAFLMLCSETELRIGNLIAQKTAAVVMLFGGRAIWNRLP